MEEQLLWEYRVQNFGNVWKSYKPEEMTAELNLWGEQGWEVVSASVTPSSTITVIAKRPLSDFERRRRSRPDYNT
jgi:hypothetical protein